MVTSSVSPDLCDIIVVYVFFLAISIVSNVSVIGGIDYYSSASTDNIDHVAIIVPVFSFTRLPNVDPILGVEMLSTGEVASFGYNVKEKAYRGHMDYLKAKVDAGDLWVGTASEIFTYHFLLMSNKTVLSKNVFLSKSVFYQKSWPASSCVLNLFISAV